MKEEKNYKGETSAVLKADSLKRLYEALEAEEAPFEAGVRKTAKGGRLVTISAEPKHIKHFTDILNRCKGV